MDDDYYIFDDFNDETYVEDELKDSEKTSFMCFSGEPDLENVMTGDFKVFNRSDCRMNTNEILRWTWESWRMAIGPPVSYFFAQSFHLLNIGARNANYNDIGEIWRDELEIKNLQGVSSNLWNKVKPFYKLLHAVLRNLFQIKFKTNEIVDLLPAHLLGDMWSQNWGTHLKLILPYSEIDLDKKINETNWSTLDMVRRAEDFYLSLGLNPMTKLFWEKSIFTTNENLTNCHGTAADMHANGEDYRMLVCPKKSIQDFYIIHHEMGHIHYYMAADKNQPPIFQDGTNSAFQESIGDAIFLGVMTPQHLNRLNLIPDRYLSYENLPKASSEYLRLVHTNEFKQNNNNILFKSPIKNDNKIYDDDLIEIIKRFKNKINYPNITENNLKQKNFDNLKLKNDYSMNIFDLSVLLRMALAKIPEIPFQYITDLFRWEIFNGKISMNDANKFYWELIEMEQGIAPPDFENRDNLFDAGVKFHFADNIPYSRYFLASFLQTQIFKGLCEVTIFSAVNQNEKLPMPLHRCDIYGSKRAGKLLKKAMRLGASTHWTEFLFILTGKREITADALLEYYQPLISWLEKIVIEYNIPVGW